jgi:hypothetical protein
MEKICISSFALPEPITRAGTAGIARAAYVLPQRRAIVLFWSEHKNQMRQTMHPEKCLITSQVLATTSYQPGAVQAMNELSHFFLV